MERWFTAAKLAAMALFAVMSAGALAYQMLVVWPPQHCEAKGAWWDERDRQCLTPVPVWRFTRRVMQQVGPVSGSPPGPIERPPAPAH